MKTPKQWIAEISADGFNHPCACICERCKTGKETFLLEGDVSKIQEDALEFIAHADTLRLNWLQENQREVETWTQDDPIGESTRQFWQCGGIGLQFARDNIRDAIDVAIVEDAQARLPRLQEELQYTFSQRNENDEPNHEECHRIQDEIANLEAVLAIFDPATRKKSVCGPSAAQANDILGKPGHYI